MPSQAGPRPFAPLALLLAASGASLWLAQLPAADRWATVDAPPLPGTTAHTGVPALTLASMVPALELGPRTEAFALLGCVAVCVAATWFSLLLFRGPGRWVASVAAGWLCALGLGQWLASADPELAAAQLPFTVLALFSLGAVIRPLVRIGRLTPVAMVRGLAAASGAALLLPPAGLPLLALVALTCVLRGRGRHDGQAWIPWRARPEATLRGRDPSSSLRRGTLAGHPLSIAALGLSPLVAVGPALWGLGPALAELDSPRALTLGVPPELLWAYLPATLTFPGLALLVMMVAPLRWRGGVAIVAFVGLSMTLSLGGSPLTPTPTLVALLAIAVAGWVWLAGSVPGRPALGTGAAVLAASLLISLGLGAPKVSPLRGEDTDTTPRLLAERRPVGRITSWAEGGLIAPGDVLLAHDPELRRAWRRAQHHEGLRPDILLRDPLPYDEATLRRDTFAWVADGRRVVSDSFTMGGRWLPHWAVESGPLYWFLFDPQRAADQDFHILPEVRAPISPRLDAVVSRSLLERARYRRALGAPKLAIFPLLRWARIEDDWAGALRRAEAHRVAADVATQLPAPASLPAADALELVRAPAVDAEVGDLLFQAGERPEGTRLLLRAGGEGYRPGYEALIRWELRAGEIELARAQLRVLASDATLAHELLTLVTWSARRGTPRHALELRALLDPAGAELAAEAIGARLAILERLGRPRPAPEELAPATGEEEG